MKKNLELIPEYIPPAELAELAGISRRWVNSLVKDGKIPRPDERGFPARSTITSLLRLKEATTLAHEKLLKLAAERRQAERTDRIAEKLEQAEYIERERHHEVLSAGIKAIELVPGKMESEFAMTPATVKRLQQLLDEARREWVKEIETTIETKNKSSYENASRPTAP